MYTITSNKFSFYFFRNVKSTCKLYDQEKFKTEPSIIVGFHNGRLGNQVHIEMLTTWSHEFLIPNPEFRIFTNSFIDQRVQNLLSHMTFIHTLPAEMFGGTEFWLYTIIILKIESHPF